MAQDSVKENIRRSIHESDTKDGGKTALARANELHDHINQVAAEVMDEYYAAQMPPPENHDVIGPVIHDAE